MKRFWDEALVVEESGNFAIRLDGRPMRLPGGPALALESRALAEAIAQEWSLAGGAKGGTLASADVPLTQLAGTAQERVAPDPRATVNAIALYGETDLLCYRADGPAALAERQARALAARGLTGWRGSMAPNCGSRAALRMCPQPPASLAAMRAAVAGYAPFVLAGLGVLVPAIGSLVLGLAVADGALDARARAHELSRAGRAVPGGALGRGSGRRHAPPPCGGRHRAGSAVHRPGAASACRSVARLSSTMRDCLVPQIVVGEAVECRPGGPRLRPSPATGAPPVQRAQKSRIV